MSFSAFGVAALCEAASLFGIMEFAIPVCRGAAFYARVSRRNVEGSSVCLFVCLCVYFCPSVCLPLSLTLFVTYIQRFAHIDNKGRLVMPLLPLTLMYTHKHTHLKSQSWCHGTQIS